MFYMITYIMFITMLFLLMGISRINQMRISRNLKSTISNKLKEDIVDLHIYKSSLSMYMAVLLVVLLSALRFDVGWDYRAYYETIAFGRITNIITTREYLTIFLIKLAKKMRSPQIYFAINSIICICLTMITVKQYSKDFWVSLIFLFRFLYSF